MMLDGSSNFHNESIVYVSVTRPCRWTELYITETVDTSSHGHTADYLQEVAASAVEPTERRFGCKVALAIVA